jgi:tryptophan-rich sensory protein
MSAASSPSEECVFNNQGEFKLFYSRRRERLALAGFLALCLTVGLSGSGVSALALHPWYLTLHQPPGRPPIWSFPIVWTALYIMAGIAAWEIWRVPDVALRHDHALTAWGWQLGLKALWTPVFFRLHMLLPALLVGAALLGATLLTLWRFARLNRFATLLMTPYFCWIAFEFYLNAGFWWLNH